MKSRKIIYGSIAIGMCVAVVSGVIIYHIMYFSDVKISFLDIGQGDATLISKGSQQILIDGGPDSTVLLEQLGKHLPFWDRNIEIVIATHSDGDHIDGLIGVFENYSVDQFWHTNAGKDTSIHRELMHQVKNEDKIMDIIAYRGLEAMIDVDTRLSVVYPFDGDVNNIDDINDASIATILYVGNEIFYLGGDLSSEIEDILPVGAEITVVKASHHGSKSSTSEIFLNKTKPRDVIISAGKDNRYGHPHFDVVDRISSRDINIFRTDRDGTIVYNCSDDNCNIILNN